MQRVIKGHQIVVYGATSTWKNRGSMDPVHILMDPVHGGGPWTRGPCFVLSHNEATFTSKGICANMVALKLLVSKHSQASLML